MLMVEEMSLGTMKSKSNAEATTKTLRMVEPNDVLWVHLDGMRKVEMVPLRITTTIVDMRSSLITRAMACKTVNLEVV